MFYEANRVFSSHPQWDSLIDSTIAKENAYVKQLLVCRNNIPDPFGGANRKISYSDDRKIPERQTLFAMEFYNWSKKLQWRTSDYSSFRFPKHVYIENPSLIDIIYVINKQSRKIIKPTICLKDTTLAYFSLNKRTEYILVCLKLENNKTYFAQSTFKPNNQTIKIEYRLISFDQLKEELMNILKIR